MNCEVEGMERVVFRNDMVVNAPEPKADESKGEKVMRFDPVKPQTYYYHYSNAESQGALIAQTHGFPAGWVSPRESVSTAYSDRMAGPSVESEVAGSFG